LVSENNSVPEKSMEEVNKPLAANGSDALNGTLGYINLEPVKVRVLVSTPEGVRKTVL
jgi:hypothetical protein